MLEEFLKRLPADATEERSLLTQAFGIANTVKGNASAILSNDRLSEAGKKDDIRTMALGTPLAHLKQLHGRAAAMTAEIANLKKSFAPKAPDRADLFGEMQRRELRDHVRSLPPDQRLRAVMEDPALTDAVLLGHPSLSGLTTQSEEDAPSQLDLVRDNYLEKTFGAQLRGLAAREEVVDNVNAAMTLAIRQFGAESGLSERELAAALAA